MLSRPSSLDEVPDLDRCRAGCSNLAAPPFVCAGVENVTDATQPIAFPSGSTLLGYGPQARPASSDLRLVPLIV